MSQDNPFELKKLGDVARDKGKFRAALKIYQEATRLRPQYVAAHYERGEILVRLGNVLEGANAFALAWMHSGFQGAPGLACGRALTYAGFAFEACRVFERINAEDFDSVSWMVYADALRMEVRIREALAILPKFQELETPQSLRIIGDIYCEMGWVSQARTLLERSLIDNHAMSYDKLVSVYWSDGDYPALRTLLLKAIQRLPGNIYYPAALAVLDIVEGNIDEIDFSAFGFWSGLVDAALYLRTHMKSNAVLTGCTYQTFDVVKHIVPRKGAILEFGVRNGHSIHYIADTFPDRTVYGFDTFEGLPEDWHDVPAGVYSAGGRIPQAPNNVELVIGLFDQTLPEFVQNIQEPIAFMNIDCDLYSSTATVFANFGHLVVPGTIIVFDEYIGNEHWRDDEFKAFPEWVCRSNVKYEYIAASFFTKQAAVQIK